MDHHRPEPEGHRLGEPAAVARARSEGMARSCPAGHDPPRRGGGAERKTGRGEPASRAAVERRGDVWHLRSYTLVRQALRQAEAVRQAGFNAETMPGDRLRRPVLFQDGAAHKEQRTAIARFFTPKTVSGEYRTLMEALSDQLIGRLTEAGGGDLSATAMALAVNVAARIVGLTDSARPGMERRLEALLSLERLRHPTRWRRLAATVRSRARMAAFYRHDVRPAILARRAAPREDVISHLLTKGHGAVEILIECITYGAAGMATTREFVCMAAWHLLEDEALRGEYLEADEAARHRILHEILRLEPVVGHLYRRTATDLLLEDGNERHRVPAGALLDLDLRAANADPSAVGAAPLRLCPHRELARGVHPPALSFGDGPHRCPGAYVAIQESDIFLTRLLRLPLAVVAAPRLEWNDLIESYEVRGFSVRLV